MKKLRNQRLLGTLLLCLTPFVGVGCGGSKVVFVSESDGLVRLGPDIRGHVYFWNGAEWELSSKPVVLPEGWYAGSIDGDATAPESQPSAVDN